MIKSGQDEAEQGEGHSAEERAEAHGPDVSIVPLAIPFISGPGSIATVMILTSEAPTPYHLAVVFLAIVLTTAACYFAMIYSPFVVRFLGETGREVATKLFGLILAVIAVQFVINGATDVYRNLVLQTSTSQVDQATEES
jgi:multiple antibiotic resistance protein